MVSSLNYTFQIKINRIYRKLRILRPIEKTPIRNKFGRRPLVAHIARCGY